jgi:hypothetical protein
MVCGQCGESVAVFGPAFFCPGCGRLAPTDQFTEQISVERRKIDNILMLPPDVLAQFEADGGLTTVLENSVQNTATAIEVFLKVVFHERVPRAGSAPSPLRYTSTGRASPVTSSTRLSSTHLSRRHSSSSPSARSWESRCSSTTATTSAGC